MAKCVMFFHGGSSYAPFDTSDPRDAESFDTIGEAVAEFRYRADGRDSRFPCVENPKAWLLLNVTAKEALGVDYPDRVLRVGARGGIVMENA